MELTSNVGTRTANSTFNNRGLSPCHGFIRHPNLFEIKDPQLTDPRVPLKNPALAAFLTVLIPGAGHIYQGRTFKGVVFLVCILGTFFFGMQKSEWKALYAGEAQFDQEGRPKVQWTLGFAAQAGIGVPATLAYVQKQRFLKSSNTTTGEISNPLESNFVGYWSPFDGDPVRVDGILRLEPVAHFGMRGVQGRFEGTQADGNKISLLVGSPMAFQGPVGASERRGIDLKVYNEDGNDHSTIGSLESKADGGLARPFMNWFLVPPDDVVLGDLHRRLGKQFELAVVCTWIAGLLNVLAIWDALQGPAYGYGDEEESTDRKDEATTKEPESANANLQTAPAST